MECKLIKLPSLIIACFGLLLFSFDLKATNFYVSNSGSDSNSGTFSSPYLTIQTALNVSGAGDNVYVRGGTYAEKIWWPSSGSSGNPITLTNYNGEAAVLSGVNATNSTQGAFILISTQSYIRINGLIFRDNIMNYADGVNVVGSGTDIHITNCEFDNIGWTSSKTTFPSPSNSAHAIIFVGSTSTSLNNIFIGGNNIHDCITGYSESITLAGNVENFLVEGNTLDSNTNIGIDAAGHFTWTGAPANVNYARSGIIRDNVVSNYAGPAALDAAGGIYTDGGSYITIENNVVYNYKVGYSVGCEVAGNTNTGNIIRNNLAYNCSLSGLFLGSNTTSTVFNTEVYNNTFYECGTGTFDNGQIALQNNSGSDIRNNIMYPTAGRYAMVQMGGTTSTSTSIAYNLLWRSNGTISNFFYNITSVTNSVTADPLFTNAGSDDFHISTSSPAVNAGDPSYSPSSSVYDIDGTARVQNGRVDIGADESGSGGGGSVTVPEAGKTYYIDNPHHDLRLGANGSEDAYTTSTSTTGSNVEWVLSASPTANHFYIDCNGGGSKPRIRTDKTAFADMQATSSAGTWTRWSFTASANDTYLFTTQNQTLPRLQINNSGQVKMVTTASADTWEQFTFTEVTNPSGRSLSKPIVSSELSKESTISVFPVPASHTLNVVLPTSHEYTGLVVNDISGKVVLKGDIQSEKILLDVSSLQQGVFFMKVYSEDGLMQTVKFIK